MKEYKIRAGISEGGIRDISILVSGDSWSDKFEKFWYIQACWEIELNTGSFFPEGQKFREFKSFKNWSKNVESLLGYKVNWNEYFEACEALKAV